MTGSIYPQCCRRAAAVTAAVLVTAAGVTACSSGDSSTSGSGSTVKEYSPPGDIPDDQAFVAYSPPGSTFSLKVPEGWAKMTSNGVATFTDKLNSIQVESEPVAAAPTPEYATAHEMPAVQASADNFTPGGVETVQRQAGAAVLITYEQDSAPDSVTGKSIRDAVERYEFWKAGTEVIVTLIGPVGADNVDPWRIVSDSFAWK